MEILDTNLWDDDENDKEYFMIESILKLGFIISVAIFITLLTANVYAQISGNRAKGEEHKTWPRKTIDILRSLYLGSDGLPSREVFLRTHGLYPLNQEFELTPYFRASYAKDTLERINGRLMPRASAVPLNLDFYVECEKKHQAANSASPIWDGRVYEENGFVSGAKTVLRRKHGQLIVGGYSDGLCEKPVGLIDDNGQFIPKPSISAEQFPLLRIPPAQILFDPYEWKLLRIMSCEGKTILERERHFLPVTIYNQGGMPVSNLRFALRKVSDKASLVLECIRGNERIELAKCEVIKRWLTTTRLSTFTHGLGERTDGRGQVVGTTGMFTLM